MAFGWLRTCPNVERIGRHDRFWAAGCLPCFRVCCTTKRRDAHASLFLSSPAFFLHHQLSASLSTSTVPSVLASRLSCNTVIVAYFIASTIKDLTEPRFVWVALGRQISRCVLQASSLRFSLPPHPWLRVWRRALNHLPPRQRDVRRL